MGNELLTKNIVSELKKLARDDVLRDLEKDAITNKDFDMLDKIQKLKEEEVQNALSR